MVYLPPSAVRDGVAELVRVNPDLEKIIIITEKVSVHDAREIRAIGQTNGIDIFGGNGLGVADAWNRVRIGGALGGDNPGETLLKGSVAIFSNSGNFTTTIANYLSTAGWGTTTSISSGKDVYIHFAAPEFIHAFDNDERSKAAVMYAEPGGYYELGLQSKKPIVACVVGRWKAKLTRAVGPRRCHGRLRRRRRLEGAVVHGDVRRRRHVHAARSGLLGQGCGGHQHRPHPAGADQGDGAERHRAGHAAPRATCRSRPGSATIRACKLPTELDLPVVEATSPYRRADRGAAAAGRRRSSSGSR